MKMSARWDGHEVTVVNGLEVHAAVHGPPGAPTIVCVHGLGSSHRYFWPFARAAAGPARVVAIDLPGFGSSPVRGTLDLRTLSRTLAAWLAATGRAGSVLVGNSTGCQVVVDVAQHTPGVLGPVVLNAPTFDREARRPLVQGVRLLRDVPRERPSLILVQITDYLRCGPRRFVGTFRDLLPDPVEDKVGAVPTPVVVVRGSLDPVAPARWSREVAARAADGRYVEVAGAPHGMNYSAPEALARIVRDVLPAGRPVTG